MGQQALTESAESTEWGATPDGSQPTPVDFFPVEMSSTVAVETASTVPVEIILPGPLRSDALAPDAGDVETSSTVAVETASTVPVEIILTGPVRSDALHQT